MDATFSDIRQVPQVDYLDAKYHDHVQKSHQIGAVLELKVFWVHGHILHHIDTIFELSFELKVEENCTHELHDNDYVLF